MFNGLITEGGNSLLEVHPKKGKKGANAEVDRFGFKGKKKGFPIK